MRQNGLKTQDVVVLYTQKHLTLRQIAAQVGMSHAAVHKRLRRAGIERSQGTWVKVECGTCGKKFSKRRKRFLLSKNHYCSQNCLAVYLENPGYRPWRHGSRLARAIVGQYITLEAGWIVHHKDGDQRNNDKANLQVYASSSEHLKMHHGQTIQPLWDGSSISSPL